MDAPLPLSIPAGTSACVRQHNCCSCHRDCLAKDHRHTGHFSMHPAEQVKEEPNGISWKARLADSDDESDESEGGGRHTRPPPRISLANVVDFDTSTSPADGRDLTPTSIWLSLLVDASRN